MVYIRAKDRRVTVDMTKEMYEQFDAIRTQEGLKISEALRDAVDLYIKKHAKKPVQSKQ